MSELPQVEWLTTLNLGAWDWHGFCIGFSSISGYSREAFLDGCYLPPNNKKALGWIQQESTFWKRSLWEKVDSHISTEFKLAGDFELWSRFYAHADLYGTPSPLGGLRFQANQKTRQMEQYVVEAEKSLARMRTAFKWLPNSSRNIALQLRLNRIPKLNQLSQSMYSYLGKCITRRNFDSQDGYWDVEEYKFY
jgi:hypothetical protein